MLERLKQHCPNLIPIEDKLGVDFATVYEALDVGYQRQTGWVIIRQIFPWLLVRIQDISKSSCKPPGKVFQSTLGTRDINHERYVILQYHASGRGSRELPRCTR